MYINLRKINFSVLCILILCVSVAILVLERVCPPQITQIYCTECEHTKIFAFHFVRRMCSAYVRPLCSQVQRGAYRARWRTQQTSLQMMHTSGSNAALCKVICKNLAANGGPVGRATKWNLRRGRRFASCLKQCKYWFTHRWPHTLTLSPLADSVCPMHKCRSLASNRQRFIMWNFTFYASVAIAFNKKREGDDCVCIAWHAEAKCYIAKKKISCNAARTARTVWGTFRALQKWWK